MAKAYRANYIIAFHFGCDVGEVSDGRYQDTRYSSPGIYVVGNDYYCCPTAKQKLPKDFEWKRLAEYYGRTIYCSEVVGSKDS